MYPTPRASDIEGGIVKAVANKKSPLVKFYFFSREQEGRKMGSKTSRCSSKKQETWWQTESRVCGIPEWGIL